MKRPALVMVIVLAQVVAGIMPVANVVRALLEEGDMRGYLYPGLTSWASLGTLAATFTVFVLAAYGLGKGKLWGWWLALLANLAWTGLGLIEWQAIVAGIRGGSISIIQLAVPGISPISLILLSLPSVRRFYWRKSGTPPFVL